MSRLGACFFGAFSGPIVAFIALGFLGLPPHTPLGAGIIGGAAYIVSFSTLAIGTAGKEHR